jgi:hypothetical protein
MESKVARDSLISLGSLNAHAIIFSPSRGEFPRDRTTIFDDLVPSRSRSVPGASTSAGPFLELDGAISEVDISSNALGRTNIDVPGPLQRSSRASEGLQGRRGGRSAPGASTSAEDFLDFDGSVCEFHIPSNFRLNSNIYGSGQLAAEDCNGTRDKTWTWWRARARAWGEGG